MRAIEKVHGRAAQESRHKEIGWPVIDIPGRIELQQLALVDYGDAAGQRHGLGLIVGDVQRNDSQLVLQAPKLGAHLDAQAGVEVRKRFVHQKRFRPAHNRSRQGHSLALPAGERAWIAVQQAV